MYLNVHCSSIYNCYNMEATYMCINRWMDKEALVHIYIMEHYSAIKYAFLNYRFSSDYEHNLENTEKSKGGGRNHQHSHHTVMTFCSNVVFICHTDTVTRFMLHLTLFYKLSPIIIFPNSPPFLVAEKSTAYLFILHVTTPQWLDI